MQVKKSVLTSILTLAATAFLAVTTLQAADPSGTWTWSTPGRNGGEPRKFTLKLKVENDKLTGTISMPGRDGAAIETAITEGKIKGDEIAFSVVREMGGNKITSKYSGKLAADVIKGKIESERNGEPTSRDWEAKREKAK